MTIETLEVNNNLGTPSFKLLLLRTSMVMNVRESLKSERSVVVDNFSEENNPDDTADICSTSYQAKFKVHVNSHLFVKHPIHKY